jgi:RimJ/RimL family protein N-acetyltransferase
MTEIITARLILRPVALVDAARLAELSSDLSIARMTARIPYPNTVANVAAWISASQTSGERNFSVLFDGVQIGVCSYFADAERSDIGYWLGKAYRGQGFATEMTRAVIKHAFATTPLDSLSISHFIDNPASAVVIAKCGFKPTGRRATHSLGRDADVVALTYLLTRAQAAYQPWYAAP